MYAKSTRPSAKREIQEERSAKRDDQIARPRRAQACERSARWECAREAGRFFKTCFPDTNHAESWPMNGKTKA